MKRNSPKMCIKSYNHFLKARQRDLLNANKTITKKAVCVSIILRTTTEVTSCLEHAENFHGLSGTFFDNFCPKTLFRELFFENFCSAGRLTSGDARQRIFYSFFSFQDSFALCRVTG
jgi:hypothetical protein